MIKDITKHLKLKDHEVMKLMRITYVDPYNVTAIYSYKSKQYKWFHNGEQSWWIELQSNL